MGRDRWRNSKLKGILVTSTLAFCRNRWPAVQNPNRSSRNWHSRDKVWVPWHWRDFPKFCGTERTYTNFGDTERIGSRSSHGTYQVGFFFLDYTLQLKHSQCEYTHAPMNTRTQTLPLWASSKTEPANPRDWRSRHRHLVVDGNVTYHLAQGR